MIDSGHNGISDEPIMTRDVENALRYAAEESFPAERLERNQLAIAERLRTLTLTDSEGPVAPGTRPLRVALVAGGMFVLFSIGASAVLHVYNKFFAETEGINGGKEIPVDGTGAQPALVTRTENRLAEDNDAPPPVPSDGPSVQKGKAESQPTGSRGGQSTSRLEQQLVLFKAAKGFAESGQYAMSISRLDRLDKKYPDSPLGFESSELRAMCLVEMGRFAAAETLLKTLIRSSQSNRKKATLMRYLGDIQQRRGRCDKAVESYRRGLGLGLRPLDSQAAQNGIVKCSQ